jgi:hypothetical protein
VPVLANGNSRVAWLMARLVNRRNHIIDLVRRLTGLGTPGAMKPSIFAKFLHMLDDVGSSVREEMALLKQIEDVEKKHRFLRVAKRLKCAVPKAQTVANSNSGDIKKEPVSGFNRLLWLIILWYLFVRKKINYKKQDLTAD